MLINKVCQITGLTRKAIEYYQQKGLVTPVVDENGYRDFRPNDIVRLKETALLRRLGLDVDEVMAVLDSPVKKSALSVIKQRKELALQLAADKCLLLEQLIQGQSPDVVNANLGRILDSSSIKERLLLAFPGYWGRFISYHFGRFLDIDLVTDLQKEAWLIIVNFLDKLDSLIIPESLQDYYLSISDNFNSADLIQMADDLSAIAGNIDLAREKYGAAMLRYQAYRQSTAYKESDTAKLLAIFQNFCTSSGYYDVFIPAMRQLSPAYEDYYQKLLIANARVLDYLPQTE